ncbi:EamA family transporter [Marinactinospora rubrisoli]|uniref:EamA family transporter n=1 Tax=Marinactinospora rubrisoli TaxID=2715399 RepID=A0ABW2KIR6_9ACTN
MTGELLALAAAGGFGLTHFVSGLLSRRADGMAVALAAQIGGTLLILAVAPAVPAAGMTAPALAWGALSGVGTAVGVACLYRSMGVGKFSVVVPLSDVATVALPVVVGVAVLGDRPTPWAWCGIGAALPAMWLVSRTGDASSGGDSASGTLLALVSGVGFAVQFLALAQAGTAAGPWPLAAGRITSVAVIALLPLPRRALARMPPRIAATAMAAGAVGTSALALFALAERQQPVTLAVVLTALYPAIPAVLGLTVLRERLTGAQGAGLLLATSAVVLVTVG